MNMKYTLVYFIKIVFKKIDLPKIKELGKNQKGLDLNKEKQIIPLFLL